MLEFVKIYGERNTGTNVLQQVLEQNFSCTLLPGHSRLGVEESNRRLNWSRLSGYERVIMREAMQDDVMQQYVYEDLGWKHGAPPVEAIQHYAQQHPLLVLMISKDPYSWLLSLYRRPYHRLYAQQVDFSGFIRHYWLTVRRDNVPWAVLKNPVQLFNSKMQAYRQLSELPCHFLHLRYRDLLEDFDACMHNLALFLKPRRSVWQRPLKSAKNDPLDFADYQQKYAPDQILSQISAADLEFINAELRADVLEYWGYIQQT